MRQASRQAESPKRVEGIEPAPVLAELTRAAFLLRSSRPVQFAQRKVVTVLFCDVVGSTALGESVDPEALQGVLACYFERMKAIIESHGGSVEKFIGDAVMAVFGVPAVHEDDALRACRAAVEMRDAFPELGIEGRIGVNTGEVVDRYRGAARDRRRGQRRRAACSRQRQPGEVLIGAGDTRAGRRRGRFGAGRAARVEGEVGGRAAFRLLRCADARSAATTRHSSGATRARR